MKRLILAGACVLGLGAGSWGLAPISPIPILSTPSHRFSAQSIAGEWDASINTPGGPRSFKIVFEVKGDTLTGTVKREAGDVPLTGTIRDSTVRFSYTVNYNGNPLTLTVTATVTGDSMKGTVDFAGAAEDEFRAQRVAATRPPPAP
jgi:hypothetical protein